MGITYRGRHSSEFGLVVRTNPSILPDFETKTVKAPGSHGSIPIGTEYEPKIIPLEFGFVDKSIHGYSERLRILAEWLDPTGGVGEYIADHEPDKVYYAMLEELAINRIEHIARMGKGGLRLICHDPFAYGEEVSYDLRNNVSIPNDGTQSAYPVFDLTVTTQCELIHVTNNTNLDITGSGRSIFIGTEVSADEEPEADKKLILHDTMMSTSGWQGGSSVDSGMITGTMGAGNKGFFASDYGSEDSDITSALEAIDKDISDRRAKMTEDVDVKQKELSSLQAKKNPTSSEIQRMNVLGTEIRSLNRQRANLDTERNDRRKAVMEDAGKWVGPSLKRELSKELNSFIADIEVSNGNYKDSSGKVVGNVGIGIMEFYFRDINDNMICKVQFGDIWNDAAINHYGFALSNYRVNYRSENQLNWNDFTGIIRVVRDSGHFYPEIVTYRGGKVVGSRMFGKIIPNNSANKNRVKTIQVAIRKLQGHVEIEQNIKEIKIWDYVGEYEDNSVEVVHKFEPGDRILIDTRKGLMTLNGEERTDLFHLGTDFFTLVKGINNITMSDNVSGWVTFRNRYL